MREVLSCHLVVRFISSVLLPLVKIWKATSALSFCKFVMNFSNRVIPSTCTFAIKDFGSKRVIIKTWGEIESQHQPRTLLPMVATSRWYISRSLKVIEFWGEKRQKLMKRKNSNPTCMISAVMGRKGKSSICIMYILCPATIKSDLPVKLDTRSGHKTCFGDRVHGKYCNFDQSRSRHSSRI